MEEKYQLFFEQLYRDNLKSLLQYVYHVVRQEAQAEEIVQDVFLTAYRKIEVVFEHENPVGWLYVTAKYHLKAVYRENKKRGRQISLDEVSAGSVDPTIEKLILLSGVSQEEAALLEKHYLQGVPLQELAGEHQISLSACKMRLKRARETLARGEK